VATPFASFQKEEIILSVGRLINTKHHDRLIRIFKNLNAPNWKLVIVGGDIFGGHNFSRLQRLIGELNLTEKVLLVGEKTNVFDYYLTSRIFAFTSSVEGFPNVLGEALSVGLPVVSYDCISGPAELVRQGENGYLVEVFDDDEFINRLQFLIDNPNLLNEISRNAILSIKEFSLERIGEKFLDVLLN
jgi:glycosyltransferase involved in cell wall biosynthesis